MVSKTLIILLVSIAMASSFVCTPNYCSTVKCQNTSAEECEAEGKDFRENGSTCGCCNLCLDYLQYGDSCSEGDVVRGGVQQARQRCAPGLTCDEDSCLCPVPSKVDNCI